MDEKAIATVTVNPCLDVEKWFDLEKLDYGTVRPHQNHESPGGKGIDVSRAIKACGGNSIALGFIGGYTGEQVKGLLALEDIKTEFIEIGSETRTNVISHFKCGQELRINSPGPTITGIHFQNLLNQITKKSFPAGAVCGSTCGGMEVATSYNQILHSFKKENPSCITYLDTGEQHTMSALTAESPPDFIKPNIEEFNQLLKTSPHQIPNLIKDESKVMMGSEDYLVARYCTIQEGLASSWIDLVSVLAEFAGYYKRTTILLTLSRLGILTYNPVERIFHHAYYLDDVEVKTLVGAGDSFLGGFIVEYQKVRNLDNALREGIATSIARLSGSDQFRGYINFEKLRSIKNNTNLFCTTFKKDEVEKHINSIFEQYSKK
jgi:1-phosphofructokinase